MDRMPRCAWIIAVFIPMPNSDHVLLIVNRFKEFYKEYIIPTNKRIGFNIYHFMVRIPAKEVLRGGYDPQYTYIHQL